MKVLQIERTDVTYTDYLEPQYLDGGMAQYSVADNDGQWWAWFTDEQDAKDFLAMKTGTLVL